jgi:hypothetical protein
MYGGSHSPLLHQQGDPQSQQHQAQQQRHQLKQHGQARGSTCPTFDHVLYAPAICMHAFAALSSASKRM